MLRNDFFLLHGVTSSWSLKHLMDLVPPSQQLPVLRLYLCGVVAIYLIQGRRELVEANLHGPGPVASVSWDDIRDMVLAVPVDKADEHMYKLAQVGLEQSRERADDDYDSTNDAKMQEVYKRAALTVIGYPFVFTRKEEA
jgi:hypothetical protein